MPLATPPPDAWHAQTPGMRRRLACTDAWTEATVGLEQFVVYITQKPYMRMGAHIHPFKQSTLKNHFKIFLKKPFLSWLMKGLDMQYQVCNSISVVCSAGGSFKMSPVFKRSTLKNDFKFFLKKTFLSWPMRGLDMQYQDCNSISVVCSAGTSFKMDPVFKRSTLRNDFLKKQENHF